MKIKVSEATGPVLDWMVAKCLGADFVHNDREYSTISDKVWARGGSQERRYSTDWSQGGPIIEREQMFVIPWNQVPDSTRKYPFKAEDWKAQTYRQGVYQDSEAQYGHTPLIAAMRCFVASKLGDEVEVPDELT